MRCRPEGKPSALRAILNGLAYRTLTVSVVIMGLTAGAAHKFFGLGRVRENRFLRAYRHAVFDSFEQAQFRLHGDAARVRALVMAPGGTLWIASEKAKAVMPYDATGKPSTTLSLEEPRALSLTPRDKPAGDGNDKCNKEKKA